MFLKLNWTTSRARDTYGYNVLTLREGRGNDYNIMGRCNGGGYDMVGTVLGQWAENRFIDRLLSLDVPDDGYYGLRYINPKFNAGDAIVPGTGQTVAEREAAGESLGLERYQARYSATSPRPTKEHTVPAIDGACGPGSVRKILEAIGVSLTVLSDSRNETLYSVTVEEPHEAKNQAVA